MNELPTYLDRDGLAHYFPPRDAEAGGGGDADRLCAGGGVAGGGAGRFPTARKRPCSAVLTAFVEGRLARRILSPRGGSDSPERDVRKLAAIEALSRHGRADARLLGSLRSRRSSGRPRRCWTGWRSCAASTACSNRAERLDEARRLLQARRWPAARRRASPTRAGDGWWWLMAGADANAARLLLTAVEDGAPARRPCRALVTGLMAQLDAQRGGAFATTTANVWTVLALQRFSAVNESVPVTGADDARRSARRRANSTGRARAMAAYCARCVGGSSAGRGPAAGRRCRVAQQGQRAAVGGAAEPAAVPLKAPLAAGYQHRAHRQGGRAADRRALEPRRRAARAAADQRDDRPWAGPSSAIRCRPARWCSAAGWA